MSEYGENTEACRLPVVLPGITQLRSVPSRTRTRCSHDRSRPADKWQEKADFKQITCGSSDTIDIVATRDARRPVGRSWRTRDKRGLGHLSPIPTQTQTPADTHEELLLLSRTGLTRELAICTIANQDCHVKQQLPYQQFRCWQEMEQLQPRFRLPALGSGENGSHRVRSHQQESRNCDSNMSPRTAHDETDTTVVQYFPRLWDPAARLASKSVTDFSTLEGFKLVGYPGTVVH